MAQAAVCCRDMAPYSLSCGSCGLLTHQEAGKHCRAITPFFLLPTSHSTTKSRLTHSGPTMSQMAKYFCLKYWAIHLQTPRVFGLLKSVSSRRSMPTCPPSLPTDCRSPFRISGSCPWPLHAVSRDFPKTREFGNSLATSLCLGKGEKPPKS